MAIGGAAVLIASLYAKIGADLSELYAGLNETRGRLAVAGEQMTSLGHTLTLGLTLPIIGIGVAAVKSASDLDTQMRNIQSISKDTDDVIAELSKTFVDMSTDITATTDSARNLAEGFYFVYSAGFAGADAMDVLSAATLAGSAGLSTTKIAAEALTATLNAYGLKASEVGHVSDVLFQTVNLGVLTFDDLAVQIGDVVNTAATAGISIEDLGAAIVTLTRVGITAPESMTALHQFLLAFIDPSDKAAAAAEELGIDLSAAFLQANGLSGAIQMLNEKTGGAIEPMANLFQNVRALKGALALTREEGQPFADVMIQMADSSGAAQLAFEQQTKSFASQAASFRNSVTELGVQLGNLLMPMILDFVNNYIKPAVEWFSGLDEGTKRWIITAALLAAALGPVLSVLGPIVTLLAALGPEGLLVLGAAAGMGVVALQVAAHWTEISTFLRDSETAIRGFFTALPTWLNTKLAEVSSLSHVWWSVIGGKVTNFLSGVGVDLRNWINSIPRWFDTKLAETAGLAHAWWGVIASKVTGFVNGTLGELGRWGTSLWTGLNTKLAEISTLFHNWWAAIGGKVTGFVTTTWGALDGWYRRNREAAFNTFPGLEKLYDNFWSAIGRKIEDFLHNAAEPFVKTWEGIKTAWAPRLTEAQTAVTTMVGQVQTAITGLAGNVSTWIGTNATRVAAIGTEFMAKVRSGVEGAVGSVRDGVVSVVDRVWEWIQGNAARVQNLGKELINKVSAGVADNVGAVAAPFTGVIDSVAATFSSAWQRLKNLGGTIVAGITQGVEETLSSITNKVGEVIDRIFQWFSDRWASVKNIGRYIVSGILQGVNEAWGDFTEALRKLVQAVIDWLNDVLDISSPSGVTMEIGRQMVAGLVVGLMGRQGWRDVGRAARRLATMIEETVREDLGIHSPSSVAGEMGAQTAAGLAQGLSAFSAGSWIDSILSGLETVWGALTSWADRFSAYMAAVGESGAIALAHAVHDGLAKAFADPGPAPSDLAKFKAWRESLANLFLFGLVTPQITERFGLQMRMLGELGGVGLLRGLIGTIQTGMSSMGEWGYEDSISSLYYALVESGRDILEYWTAVMFGWGISGAEKLLLGIRFAFQRSSGLALVFDHFLSIWEPFWADISLNMTVVGGQIIDNLVIGMRNNLPALQEFLGSFQAMISPTAIPAWQSVSTQDAASERQSGAWNESDVRNLLSMTARGNAALSAIAKALPGMPQALRDEVNQTLGSRGYTMKAVA